MPLTEDEIAHCYRIVLGREPDISGLQSCKKLSEVQNINDPYAFAKLLVSSSEFKSRIEDVITSTASKLPLSAMFQSSEQEELTSEEQKKLEGRIAERVKRLYESQKDYQPIYNGNNKVAESTRLNELLADVQFVRDHYNYVREKHHIRILDVGCNAGYVSFKLAETFPNTVGIDVNAEHVALCNDIMRYTGSPSRFYVVDFLDSVEADDLSLEDVDCVLLLNILHQFIFARGLPHVQALLGRLAQRVDVIFVELAKKEEYARHPNVHLLPDDPADVMSGCVNCNVQLLKDEKRPLYKVTRQITQFDRISIRADKQWFADTPAFGFNRKYYVGNGLFLKIFRFTRQQGANPYLREKRALLRLNGLGITPRVFDWACARSYGAILMEEILGRQLYRIYNQYSSPDAIQSFLEQYLLVAREIANAKLYHNDLGAQNLFVTNEGTIRVIDFEQADEIPYIDPFGSMLWLINDILHGESQSVKDGIYKKLKVEQGSERVDRRFYPDLLRFSEVEHLHEFIGQALNHNSWFGFVHEWSSRLTSRRS